MSTTDALQDLLDFGERLEQYEISRRDAVLEDSKTVEEMEQIVYNHTMSQTEVAKLCGMALNTFKERMADAVEEGILPRPLFLKGRWLYTPRHVHAIMDWLNVYSWKDQGMETVITNIQNQKGGTGKSTTTVCLAVQLALNYQERPRCLIIDLDPQGTLRNFVAPDANDESALFLSAVDLMLGGMEGPDSLYGQLEAAGLEHDSIVEAAVLDTHLPNLKLIPAFTDDERFTSVAWESQAKHLCQNYLEELNIDPSNPDFQTPEFEQAWDKLLNQGSLDEFLPMLKTKVIEPLKDQFDLIFIDTGPQVNPLVWTANFAANNMLIPLSPRKLDWMSTQRFLRNLGPMMTKLPEHRTPLKDFKVVAVNYDDEHNRDFTMLKDIKDALGKRLMTSVVKRSMAFEAAARLHRTVLDLRKVEKRVSNNQLDKAVDSVRDLAREFTLNVREQFTGDKQ